MNTAIRDGEHESVAHELSKIFANADIGAGKNGKRQAFSFHAHLRFGNKVEYLRACIGFVPAKLVRSGNNYADPLGHRQAGHGETGFPVLWPVVDARQKVAVQIGERQVVVHHHAAFLSGALDPCGNCNVGDCKLFVRSRLANTLVAAQPTATATVAASAIGSL